MSTLKGTKASLSSVPCFLYLVPSSTNVFFFSYYMAGSLLDRPRMLIYFSVSLVVSTIVGDV